MSLLNSILSSINDGQGSAPKPSITASVPKPNPLPRKDNTGLSAARPQPASTSVAQKPSQNLQPKRKAEDVGREMKSKAPRVDTAVSAPISRSTTSSPAQRQSAVPPPKQQMAYRGTMGGVSKAAPVSGVASKPAPATSSAPSTPSIAPKSGYLATLERARAAQEAAKQMGQIKHKPVEKLTKKDRLRMQAEAAAAQKGKATAGRGVAGAKARSKSAEPAGAKGGPLKKDRKPADVGYKGTMRAGPTPLAYTGTMRPSGSAVARKPQPGPSRSQDRYRYASYSDEEDDMEEEEEDYESESDMEAGMDDVYREEEEALRAARREDAEALREENELKRAKLERKRKLEQLAAEQKKKGSRY